MNRTDQGAKTGSLLILILVALGGAACGSDKNAQTESTNTTSGAPAAPAPQLSNTPIDLSTAYSSKPAAAALSVAECPWLSDAEAKATAQAEIAGKPLVRRRATNNLCRWSVNAGFALELTRSPLAEAKELSDIKYNMDIDPVLAAQPGPGQNASVLKDPTWDENNPRPFAIGFDLDGERFLIRVTGMRTSVNQLREAATKVAAAASGPGLEQTTSGATAATVSSPTLDPCAVEPAQLVTLFGGKAGDTFTAKPDVAGSICEYRGSFGGGIYRIRMGLQFSGDPLTDTVGRRYGYLPAEELGPTVYQINNDSSAGAGHSARGYRIGRPAGYITLNISVSDENYPTASVKTLIDNLMARTSVSG